MNIHSIKINLPYKSCSFLYKQNSILEQATED